MPPRVLLTATLRWPTAARIATALAALGCRVAAVVPRQHPVSWVRTLARHYPYAVLRPFAALEAAIDAERPDILIPCDDAAALHLSALPARWWGNAGRNAQREMVLRSLGEPAACRLATTRAGILALAAQESVRVPATAVVSNAGELSAWLARCGTHAVIKIDSTWGGQGVAIVSDSDEAQRCYARMAVPPGILRSLVRLVLDRDPGVLRGVLRSTRPTVTVQEFIPGAPANRAVACWQGKVLAGISVEAIRTQHATGPATVVRVIDDAEMTAATARLVERLGVSGLWGFDFVRHAGSRAAYLIEVNPRATPICHLPLGADRNLLAALYRAMTGRAPQGQVPTLTGDVIALFPGEWRRNPASHHLVRDCHDVPWDEPALVRDCLDLPWSERGWAARAWRRARPGR